MRERRQARASGASLSGAGPMGPPAASRTGAKAARNARVFGVPSAASPLTRTTESTRMALIDH